MWTPDADDDGDEDIFVTNLSGEGHDLYVNDATGIFEPGSAAAGLKHPSLPFTGFGTALIDIDNDGRLDLLTVRPRVRVTWPDGRVEEWADLPIDRYTTLTAGTSR